MDLSVMICTWNNSKRLAITLDTISRCVIPNNLKWELVLVNNNCTDTTDQIAQEFMSKLPIVYVYEPQQGLSRARNAGLQAVSGQFIIFTDDDVKPSPEWLTSYWNTYQEKSKGFFFGGPIDSEFEGPSVDMELLKLAPFSVKGVDYGSQARQLVSHEYFIGPNWACPTKALREIGGFDPNLGLNPATGTIIVGEEKNIMDRLKKIGLTPWYVPEARLIHLVPADKCRLKHIAARNEAGTLHETYENAEKYFKNNRGSLLYGLPRWVYKDAFILWLKWMWARLRLKNGYQEYIEWRRMVGTIKGLRKVISARRRALRFS